MEALDNGMIAYQKKDVFMGNTFTTTIAIKNNKVVVLVKKDNCNRCKVLNKTSEDKIEETLRKSTKQFLKLMTDELH